MHNNDNISMSSELDCGCIEYNIYYNINLHLKVEEYSNKIKSKPKSSHSKYYRMLR